MEKVLDVQDLVVRFYTYAGVVKALEKIDFDVRKGETLGLIGETGCGKSVTALSIMRLTPTPGIIEDGKILLKRGSEEVDIMRLDESELRELRGKEISMVFQEPSEALNPVYEVGDQVAEAFLTHRLKEICEEELKQVEEDIENANPLKRTILKIERRIYEKMVSSPNSLVLRVLSKIPMVRRYRARLVEGARRSAIEMLDSVGIPDPKSTAEKYPHELSGGMGQRVVIAMAIACNPQLLIADEPTSNVDVSIQGRILDLLNDLKEEYGLSILFITHDLGIVAQVCDRVAVMYAGRLVEIAETKELFERPLHPYTRLLLQAVPGRDRESLSSIKGSVPDLINPPSGCRFHPRCSEATDICSKKVPKPEEVNKEHQVSCHHWRK